MATDLWIDGAWRPSADGATFDVVDPSTGTAFASVASGSPADATAAADAAAAAQPAWAATPTRERSEILRECWATLLQHRDDRPDIAWPGHWALFGGHMEGEETPEEAALREIEEELGLCLEPPLHLVHHGIDGVRERFVFASRLLEPLEALTLMEGQGMALLALEELETYPVVPAHHGIINRFFTEQLADFD